MLRALFISIFLISAPVFAKQKDDGSQIQVDNFYPRVKIETTMGDVTVELDRSRAPVAVNNFLRYVDKRSYEDTIFHRVVADFIVQGGGYDVDFAEKPSFADIINESGNGLKNEMYTIAMARQKDPHSSNRQFFFNMNDNVSLDPGRDWGYTVFGYVVEGNEVLDAISQVETDYDTTWGWADVPVKPVLIKRVVVLPPV
ncbi:peptidylprolyl isomerase [uncultured Paraglaciecola sp.]|uniref:peptidylprolyl isomerase n=1 Tax=uncultured Paraglaciecola sp. TaxID=1765024 RepID=UPI0030DA9D8A|tara:strand:+ start:11637 stop:12233 length:597 start_codon:yes stop_codon:yes gene_type:complete